MKSQILTIGAVTILIVVVIFAAVYIGFSLKGNSETEHEDPRPAVLLPESTAAPESETVSEAPAPEATAALSSTTAIPGYDTIRMKAGTQDQRVRLYNPSENGCYFLISIILPDGKEIYRSDLIAPGKATETIRLSSVLEAGIYDEAALLYSCFSLSDLHPMNGATVKITLEVLP